MRKIFGVAGAIALSIIPNPVFSEDMPPIPNPGSCEIPIRSEEWRRDPWHIKNISEFGGKIEVVRTIFPGNDKFKMGLYEIKNDKKSLILAEMGLVAGATPFEEEAIIDRHRQPYPGRKAVGMYPIKRGFALLEQQADGRLTKQGFREKRGVYRAFGKPRKAKNLCHYEEKIDFDFDSNLIIGCN